MRAMAGDRRNERNSSSSWPTSVALVVLMLVFAGVVSLVLALGA